MIAGIAATVLAAGRGARLGEPGAAKPLLRLRGRPLVAWALDAACASGLRPVLVVVGHRASDVEAAVGEAVGEAVARAAPDRPGGVKVVRAAGWERGIARSLAAALDTLEPDRQVDAVCVGLADQPLVGPEAYRRVAAARREGATLAVATYGGARRNPVLLAREVWPAARSLDGDEGARVLMRAHPVAEVACDDTGDPTDVDTLDDLATIEHGWEA